MMSKPTYEYDFDPEAQNNTAASVYRLAVSGGSRVLDLGAGPGIVAAHLQNAENRTVTCFDADPELLALAKQRGVEETLAGDLDSPNWVALLEGRQFDVIILADVLEHLVEPGAVLDAIHEQELLSPDGFLVVSIPNAAHDAVVGELMTSHFTYQPTGLLDRTHIRFFTKDSFTELAEEHGFDVTEVHRTLRTLEQTEFKARAYDLDAEARQTLGRRGLDGRTYQYVMRLVPMTATSRAGELSRKIDHLQAELVATRSTATESSKEAERLRAQSEQLRAEAEKAEAKAARQAAELERWHAAELERRQQLAAKTAELQKSNRRLRRVLAEQRAEHIRRLGESEAALAAQSTEIHEVNAEHKRVAAGLHAELKAAARERRRLEREIEKMHQSFTWKAGRAVKSLLYPGVLVRRLLTRQPPAKSEPASTMVADSETSTPITVPAEDSSIAPPAAPLAAQFVLAESPVRSRYEEEAAHGNFERSDGRRVAFAVTTLDFDEGRGDVYVAVGVGRQLRSLGADVVYRTRGSWYDYGGEFPDVVVAMHPRLLPSQLDPEVRVVAWVRNEVTNWLAHNELQMFDGILCSSERSRQAIAERYAGPTGVLPIGVDTELFTPPQDVGERTGAVSTANQWGRERYVNRALRSAPIKFPLAIYGQSRGLAETLEPYSHGLVSFFALPGLYQQALIVLDDFNHTTVGWGNVNSRLFESLAAGALPITNTARGLSELGLDEVPTYGAPTELNALVERLIDDPEGTANLAKSLSEVVRTEHGFDRRAESLVAFLDQIDARPVEERAVIGFFPDYRATNPYQSMLYAALEEAGAVAVPIETNAVNSLEPPFKRTEGAHLFHLHWTAPILGPANTEREAISRVHGFLAKLDRFIGEGGMLIWTVHNVLPHECRFPVIETMLRQELADRAHAIHVMCPETVAAVGEHYHLPQDRVRVVPHASFVGIYPDGYDSERARSELGIAPDDVALLAFGGIRRYKGIDRLLDALDEALVREPRLRLVVVGQPGRFPGVAELEERCHSHPRIIANFNPVADDDLQVFFKACDVAVLPHLAALNSGAQLLAYSFARPVIAPKVGCLVERLDPAAALVFDPDKATTLVEALTQAGTLANHEARLAARKTAESFLPAEMAADFAKMVESLVGPPLSS